MKVTVPGKTPMERLTNFAKRVIAVDKADVEREDAKWKKERAKRRKPK